MRSQSPAVFGDFDEQLVITERDKKDPVTVKPVFAEHFPVSDPAGVLHLIGGVLRQFDSGCQRKFLLEKTAAERT